MVAGSALVFPLLLLQLNFLADLLCAGVLGGGLTALTALRDDPLGELRPVPKPLASPANPQAAAYHGRCAHLTPPRSCPAAPAQASSCETLSAAP